MSALVVSELVTGFGAHAVLHGVDFEVREGEIACLLGLNGAGKSVTLKAISGLLPVWSGSISLGEVSIVGLAPEARVALGLAHVPQSRSVFVDLSVEQNLRLGGYTIRDKARLEEGFAKTYELFPRLAERRSQIAGLLSGGEQQMLVIGRALMSSPKLVLVDEPTCGLSPIVISALADALRTANSAGTTFLLVEQNVAFALSLSNTVHLMERGQMVYSGTAKSLDNEKLMRLLGVGELVGLGSSDEIG